MTYPTSFPNAREEMFLRVVLSSDADFPRLWEAWRTQFDFDAIDPATLHLIPFAHTRMRALGMQADPLYGKVKGIYKNAWVRNQQILWASRPVLDALAARGIPAMLLKGLALLTDVYQDMGARFTGDADIAVPPEHAPEAVGVMRTLGFRCQKPWMPDVSNPRPSIYHVTKSTDFENEKGAAVDMHWNVFGLYHHARKRDILFLKDSISAIASRRAFWQSAVPLSHSDFPAKRLSNEDLLIHVIIHGSEESAARSFRWVADAAMIVRTLPLDWQRIIERSRAFRFTVELRAGFRYLRERMDVPVPESFLSDLDGIPVTPHELREFHRRGTIVGGDRFSPLNNLLMLWYGYWVYEPNGRFPKTVVGYAGYAARSLGMHEPRVFLFIVKKYIKKTWRRITGPSRRTAPTS